MTARPTVIAATFAAFVDTLIPGDDIFPVASAAGTHGLVLDRVRDRLGVDTIPGIVALLGDDFATRHPTAKRDAVERLGAR